MQAIAVMSAGSARLFWAGWLIAIAAQMIAGIPVSKAQPKESGPRIHAATTSGDMGGLGTLAGGSGGMAGIFSAEPTVVHWDSPSGQAGEF
jgi:hypothetical protein